MLRAFDSSLTEQISKFGELHLIFAASRSLIAFAQITILVFTPATALFVPVAGQDPFSDCDRTVVSASAYCVLPWDTQTVNYLMIASLLFVASGLLPQLGGLVHIWASFSFAQSVSLPDGGDHVAQVVTVFLAFVSLGHNRVWYWSPARSSTFTKFGSAIGVGAVWGLRLQVAWIYLNSSLSKLSVSEWQEGSALYYVTRQEFFGSAGPLGGLVLWITEVPIFSLILTWGTIAAEIAIAVLVLLPGKKRALAFLISLLLHSGIIVVLGLFSFGLIMIGAVLAASAPGVKQLFNQCGVRIWQRSRQQRESVYD